MKYEGGKVFSNGCLYCFIFRSFMPSLEVGGKQICINYDRNSRIYRYASNSMKNDPAASSGYRYMRNV